MGKKKNRKEFPSIDKLNALGFRDGYNGNNNKEDELITSFCKRGISTEQITPRILAYSLGYKKGNLIYLNGLDNCKLIDGEVVINNKAVKLDNVKENEINEKIKSLVRPKKKKGR